MRRSQRLIAASVLIALSSTLAGCSSGFGVWDPTDLLDFLDTKKKLPGERKPVFPDGVPGLEQGVPKELYKGAAQQQDAPAVQPEEPKPQKSAKKARGKQPASTAPAQDAAQAPAAGPDGEAAAEEEGSTAAAPPAPKPKKIVRGRPPAPPPDAPAPQAAQPVAQPQQSASPFPAPMPAGTF